MADSLPVFPPAAKQAQKTLVTLAKLVYAKAAQEGQNGENGKHKQATCIRSQTGASCCRMLCAFERSTKVVFYHYY